MRYTLILWDFDGTLADSLPGLLEIFNRLAPEFGFQTIDDLQAVRDTPPLQFLRGRGVSWWKLPALRRALVQHQKDQMADIPLVPGISDVLERLHTAGYRAGILSSNSEENIRTCLRANQAESWFESIASHPHLLGKQRGLRRVLRHRKLKAREVLYVGDEVRDIIAAHRVGMDAAAVTWGINTRNLLARHQPTQLIDHPTQLLQWLVS